jgi:hypothetical protein
VLIQLVGAVLIVRGIAWTLLLRRTTVNQHRSRRWSRAVVRRIVLLRGIGSVLLGLAIVVKLYDIAIVLAICLLMWELGRRRRRQVKT